MDPLPRGNAPFATSDIVQMPWTRSSEKPMSTWMRAAARISRSVRA